jgi:hypothetical protein
MQIWLQSPVADLIELLPQRMIYDQLLIQADVGFVDTPSSLFNPLTNSRSSKPIAYDAAGLSSYGRIAIALLKDTVLDHQSILDHQWIIPQLILLECLASDINLQPNHGNAMFHAHFNSNEIGHILDYCNQSLTFVFSHLMADLPQNWHFFFCDAIKNSVSEGGETRRPLENLVLTIYKEAIRTEHTTVKYTRILRRLLQLLLKHSDMTRNGLDQWLSIAERCRKSCMWFIIHSIL